MVKTQIQIPDLLYEEAKRVAREREMSFAEVVRRGIEYIVRCYPALESQTEWEVPEPIPLGIRPDLEPGQLRDYILDDIEARHLAALEPANRIAEEPGE